MKSTCMTAVFAGLCLTVLTFEAHSQTVDSYQRKIDHFRSMQKTGSVLLLAGLAVEVTGVILYINNVSKTSTDAVNSLVSSEENPAFATLIILGAAGIVTGAIFSSIGNRKTREYLEKLKNLNVDSYYTPEHAGITISLTF